MSIACVKGGGLCDGCGGCHREPEVIAHCAQCGDDIYAVEDYYEIDGEIIHEDCLREWAEKYLVKSF